MLGSTDRPTNVPAADAATNVSVRDVIGNKEDAGSLTADAVSLVALARKGAKEAWEVEHHFHVRERWLGLAGASEGFAPFVVLPHATNDGEFGPWTEVLDADDTPIIFNSFYAHDSDRGHRQLQIRRKQQPNNRWRGCRGCYRGDN
ncbi:MAG: hypothetical protein GY832_01405 [Chloroflexi bacterium]|nr:hypothetical protein [Chloroflexota bacterium]